MKQNVKYFLKSQSSKESWTGYFLNGTYYETQNEFVMGYLEGSNFYYNNELRGSLNGLELTRFEPKAVFTLEEQT